MAKIIAAVNANTQAPILTTARQGSEVLTGLAAETHLAFEAYHAAEDRMAKLPTVEERRSAASEVAQLGREALSLMRQRGTDDGLHEEHVSLRGDAIFRLMVRGIECHCELSESAAWLVVDGGYDEDEDEAAA